MHTESEEAGYYGHTRLVERRGKPRIYSPFPVLVKGIDQDNSPFKVITVIDNLSIGGLYLRLTPCLQPGTKLFLLIHLFHPLTEDHSPCVAFLGRVLRIESMPGAARGVAAAITKYRYLERWPFTACPTP